MATLISTDSELARQEAERERQQLRDLARKLQALSPEQLRQLEIDLDRLYD